MLLADKRIELDARPAPTSAAPVEVVMLGHCPSPDGSARWDRLARDASVLAQIAALGFIAETQRLQALLADPPPQDGDDALRALYLLPIPVRSLGYFQVLFPQAFDTPARYRSTLAGDRAWLPAAVQDFFDGGAVGESDTRLLWVIRVPEAAGEAGWRAFLPRAGADMCDTASLGAFERALLVPRAGVLVLPDLERLMVPANLPDVPRVRLPNPQPMFLPCGTDIDDTHRERRYSAEIPPPEAPVPAQQVVPAILRSLAALRPDLQCLLAVPFDLQPEGELPVPSVDFLGLVGRLADALESPGEAASGAAELGGKLRHMQLLYPYLRGAERPLGSPGGLVAGMQARVSQRHGSWRSIAGRPLPGASLPWPPLSSQAAVALREQPGVSVLLRRAGQTVLDDERLAAPCLPLADLRRMNAAARAMEHWRSAEIMRFIGWIRRELRQLGERLVFDLDPQDPRPEMALSAFFNRLHAAGGLRGARPEEAFRIRRLDDGEASVAFEIEIAPAYPIDLLRLTFLHDQHAGGPGIDFGVSDG
ncbi:MAG: hypothetical protein HGA47_11525 [Zoogloea sp.]|nr:hypothetical protein [Zoogloea sp.]